MKKKNNFGRGDRSGQRRRRKINNKDVLIRNEEFLLIDGNYSNRPYSYCCYRKAYLTKNQTILHRCQNRSCPSYKTMEWALEHGK